MESSKPVVKKLRVKSRTEVSNEHGNFKPSISHVETASGSGIKTVEERQEEENENQNSNIPSLPKPNGKENQAEQDLKVCDLAYHVQITGVDKNRYYSNT